MTPVKLKVLYVSSEAAPFAKSGGLGDVAGSLPKALDSAGVDCRVIMPKYSSIPKKYVDNLKYVTAVPVQVGWRMTGASVYKYEENETSTYFVENNYYFEREGLYGYFDDAERFAFFCRAVLEMLPLIDFKPDIIHCNDWQTGPVCLLLQDVYKHRVFYRQMKCVFTIHNMQYQGTFDKSALELLDLPMHYFCAEGMEFYGAVSYMKAGIISANAITTVSGTYAKEIQTGSYGFGMDGLLCKRKSDLCGIVNGIDYNAFNPETDSKIFSNYNNYEGKQVNKTELQKQLGLDICDAPLFSMITRLVSQKGLDLISMCLDELVYKNVQLVFLGTGDGYYEHMLKFFEAKYPKNISVNLKFDTALAQKIYAGSDFFLMPSLFEPCGLGQLIAMRYGTIPIVRKTGGLSDTVTHYNALTGEGTGFMFEDFVADGMMWGIDKAMEVYEDKGAMKKLCENGMKQDYSWGKSAKEYAKMYYTVQKSK